MNLSRKGESSTCQISITTWTKIGRWRVWKKKTLSWRVAILHWCFYTLRKWCTIFKSVVPYQKITYYIFVCMRSRVLTIALNFACFTIILWMRMSFYSTDSLHAHGTWGVLYYEVIVSTVWIQCQNLIKAQLALYLFLQYVLQHSTRFAHLAYFSHLIHHTFFGGPPTTINKFNKFSTCPISSNTKDFATRMLERKSL